MATATFIGDPRGGANPPECEMAGIVFPLGQPIDVPDMLAAKLAGNGHFRVDGGNVLILDPVEQPQKRRGRPPKVRPDGDVQ